MAVSLPNWKSIYKPICYWKGKMNYLLRPKTRNNKKKTYYRLNVYQEYMGQKSYLWCTIINRVNPKHRT